MTSLSVSPFVSLSLSLLSSSSNTYNDNNNNNNNNNKPHEATDGSLNEPNPKKNKLVVVF